MKMIRYFTSLIFGITAPFIMIYIAHASPDVFRWTDEQGRTHFTDDIKKIPEEYRREAFEKGQKDIPPLAPPEEHPKTKIDESPEVPKKYEAEESVESKPRLDKGIVAGPPGIGYGGQQIESQRVEIVNGGVRHIPELGFGYTLTLLNKTEEPIWVILRIGKEPLAMDLGARGVKEGGIGCITDYGSGKLPPGQMIVYLCDVVTGLLSVTQSYPVNIYIFDNEHAWRTPGAPGLGHEPIEAHTFKFKFKYEDIKNIKDLEIAAKKYSHDVTGTHHEPIQSDWVEIVTSRIYRLKQSPGSYEKYVLDIDLINKTRKDVWVMVSIEDSQNKEICSSMKKIDPREKNSFGCRQAGSVPLNAEFMVNIHVYERENDAIKGQSPLEILQTVLRSG